MPPPHLFANAYDDDNNSSPRHLRQPQQQTVNTIITLLPFQDINAQKEQLIHPLITLTPSWTPARAAVSTFVVFMGSSSHNKASQADVL